MKYLMFVSIFSMLILAGCGLETKTLPQFYEKDLETVNKVVIVDGSNGNKKTITDPPVIEEFLNRISDVKFIPEKNQDKRVGWRYSITLFQKGEDPFQFTLTEVNENYYYTEPAIYPIVDEIYKDLKVKVEPL
ncbi:hypothetical protein PH210_19615 [Paenibacillus sp. BSR1-1]|uniref:hypothetical protein n=1 Tax=Paenibacillus sp. BSR1-1 TaxID=3020845 RepID=UPI0025AF1345|nr:hypothetical protein [Paenibacillus sp. BSR1-1]MDN3018392.1 hypothetical protein [Paenibacillus sp. BSR1-1]